MKNDVSGPCLHRPKRLVTKMLNVRGFDFESRQTTSLRDKEKKQDYRFANIFISMLLVFMLENF